MWYRYLVYCGLRVHEVLVIKILDFKKRVIQIAVREEN